MKLKHICFILIIFSVVFCFLKIETQQVYADDEESIETQQVYADDEESIETQLENNIDSQLNNIDFSNIDDILNSLDNGTDEIFKSSNFRDKVTEILNGNFNGGFVDVFKYILNSIFDILLQYLPLLASILAIAIIGSIMQSLKSGFAGKATGDVINFVLIGIIVILCANVLKEVVLLTTNTITNIKTQMEIIFPILLTLMSAMGGAVAVKVYQPAVAVLCSIIVHIFSNIIIPIFTASSIFNIVGNISSGIKLNKFVQFFNSLSKYIIATTFTIFIAFLSLQGITASMFDGIHIRTAKFAVKSYVPILGGYLSDGFDLILSSSLMIKNAIGVGGLILLICSILFPIFKIVILGFGFKLVAAIIEPICDSKISTLISSIAKSLNMLIASILAVAFMYFLTIGLIICTSNAII